MIQDAAPGRTLLFGIARAAFFKHLGDRPTSTTAQRLPSTFRRRMGVCVKAESSTGQEDEQDLVLGFTGYPMPQKEVYQMVKGASIAIAACNPLVPLDQKQVSFEVTILSLREPLATKRIADISSAAQFGRDLLCLHRV